MSVFGYYASSFFLFAPASNGVHMFKHFHLPQTVFCFAKRAVGSERAARGLGQDNICAFDFFDHGRMPMEGIEPSSELYLPSHLFGLPAGGIEPPA